MKLFAPFLALGLLLICDVSRAQDILFSTNLEDDRLSKMYALLRKTWINETGEDPLNQQFEEEIEFDLSEALRDLSGDSRGWVRDFQQLMNMDFISSKVVLKINKPKFVLKDQFSSITPFYDEYNNLHWQGKHFLKGVSLSAQSISLTSKIPRLNNQNPIELDVRLESPVINMIEKVTTPIYTQWLTRLDPENLFIQAEKVGVFQTISEIHEHPELIEMTFGKLNVPKVEIEVGRRRIKFDPAKIEQFTRSRLDDLKLLVLELIVKRYEQDLDNIVSTKPPFIELKRDQFFGNEELGVGSKVVSLEAPNGKDLSVGFDLAFCTGLGFDNSKDCFQAKTQSMSKSEKPVILNPSSQVMTGSDLHLQIKEKTINEMLAATLKTSMWEEVLNEERLTWGTYGAFLHNRKAGDNFYLYLDFYHHLNKKDSVLVGQKKIHFAVKLKVSLSIVPSSNNNYHLKLVVKELFNDDRSLLDGYPELNLVSDVGQVPRFKKKLLSRLQTKLLKFENRVLVDVELPELANSLINQVTFSSDANGTLQGFFDLQ